MKTNEEKFDVIVIGGGASGMMAAGRAGERGLRVLLVEKNERLGEKLNITGGGRCNITNAIFDHREFLKVYGVAQDFLFSPFSQFGVKDTFTFFARLGLPLVTEARTRVFPHTQKAEDVTKTLARYMKKNGVVVKTGAAVTKILTEEKQILGVQATLNGVPSGKARKDKFYAKNLILATGGLSHPETGSTGDGFKWLAGLGHTVRQPSPDVVPLEVKDQWVKDLSGVSLSFMKITFFLAKNHLAVRPPSETTEKAFSKTGKILFTHFGLSGPLILNSAREVKKLLAKGKVTATIDAFPDTDLGALDKQIVKIFDANKNKELKTVFKDQVAPAGTGEAIFPLLSFNTGIKVHSVTIEQRQEIVHLLKSLPLTVIGLMGFDRAVVSDGGVLLAEIDTRTMRSKIHPNLFILGDLLDINRQSGGYSLQLCWTTGYVAAEHIK